MKFSQGIAAAKRHKRVMAGVIAGLLVVGAAMAIYAYRQRTAIAPAPSPTVTVPDSPQIQEAADLDAANDTLDKLNTINSDFHKEEARLKQLMDEAH